MKEKNKDPNRFYVYTHAKPDGTVFYVGKGCGRRANVLSKSARCVQHNRTVAKYGRENIIVQKVDEGLSESAAGTLESALIAAYREAGYDLANVTDGGGGVAGFVHPPESRKKISDGIKLAYANDPQLGKNATEHALKIAKLDHVIESKRRHALQKFDDEDFRRKWVEDSAIRVNTPEHKKKALEGHTKKFSDRAFLKSHSKQSSDRWKDPEYRAKMMPIVKEAATRESVKDAQRAYNASPRGLWNRQAGYARRAGIPFTRLSPYFYPWASIGHLSYK